MPPSQPNLSPHHPNWPLRFWLATALTGLVAGLVGGLLMRLLIAAEHLAWNFSSGSFLDAVANASTSRHFLSLLAAALLVGVAALLFRKSLPPAEQLEASIWFRSGQIPFLPTLLRAVNSIISVALGTSLGRESPIKQAGGAIACRFATLSRLSPPEQRILVAAGVGAGMAAAYNVPVGGALFALEVLLGAISLRLAIPALLCSGIATASSWILLPTTPVYTVPEYPLSFQLTLWALLAGPILGLATIPLVRAIGWADLHKPKRPLTTLLTPILLLSLLAFASLKFPQLLGNGKDAVQLAFNDQFALSLLIILPALKLLSTTASLASGATGGLFTPTMTIGALLGALLGHAFNHLYPGISLGACSVIGACAFLAAASQGPISALVLVLELTRHLDATMAPMLLAVTTAMLAARRIESRSIYSIRIPPPPLSPPSSPPIPTISSAAPYTQVLERFLQNPTQPLQVLDHKSHPMGQIPPDFLTSTPPTPMPPPALQASDLITPP